MWMAFDDCAGQPWALSSLVSLCWIQCVNRVSNRFGGDHHRIARQVAAFRQGSRCKPDEHAHKPDKEGKREEIVQRCDAQFSCEVNFCDDQHGDEDAHNGLARDEPCADQHTSTFNVFCCGHGFLGRLLSEHAVHSQVCASQHDVRDDAAHHDGYGEAQWEVDPDGNAHDGHFELNQRHGNGSPQHDHLQVQIPAERTLNDGADELSLWCKQGCAAIVERV